MAKAGVIIRTEAPTRPWRWPAISDLWVGLRGEWHFSALLALCALSAIPYGTVGLWQTWFECTVFVLAGIWIYRQTQVAHPALQLPGVSLLLPWLLLLVLAIVQTLPLWPTADGAAAVVGRGSETLKATVAANVLSASPFETWRFVLKLLALVLAVALLRAGVEGHENRFRRLAHIVIGIGVGSAGFALLRQALQASNAPFVLPWLQPGVGFGQFINHNHFALLMEMTWGLSCGLALTSFGQLPAPEEQQVQPEPNNAWLLYGGASLLVWLALVLSNSRGGIYSMLGQFCCLAVLWPRLRSRSPQSQAHREECDLVSEGRARQPGLLPAATPAPTTSWLRRALTSLALVVIIALGIVWVGGDSLASRLDQLPRELGVEEVFDPRLHVRRMEMWLATGKLIQLHPWVGNGLGAFEPAVTKFYDASGNWTLRQAHNDYLELLATGGLLSGLLLLWFGGLVWRQARRQLRTTAWFYRGATGGALVGLSGVALHSLVDFGLHLPVNALAFGALIVLATTPSATSLTPTAARGNGLAETPPTFRATNPLAPPAAKQRGRRKEL